jgi:hypothetical protein
MFNDDLPNGTHNFSSCFSEKITDIVPLGLNILKLKKEKNVPESTDSVLSLIHLALCLSAPGEQHPFFFSLPLFKFHTHPFQ